MYTAVLSENKNEKRELPMSVEIIIKYCTV